MDELPESLPQETASQRDEALRQSEERFRLMAEGVRDYAVFMLDPGGRIVTWNAGAKRIKGYDSEEIIGQPFSRFHPPEDLAVGKPGRLLERARAAGHVEDQGWRMRKDGSRFWASVLLTALYDDKGRLRGFSTLTRDMTEGGRFEEMLRSVVNNVIDGIITIDERGVIESFNPAAERIFGYKASEVIGRNVKSLMPEPYRGEHDGYVANYLTTGHAKIIGIGREVVGQRKDGSTFPMDLAVSEFTLGVRRLFTGIVRDITERKRLEQQLQDRLQKLADAEERIRSVVNNVIDGIITIDEHGVIESFNPAAEKLFGYEASDVIGQNVKSLMPEPYRGEHDGYVANYLATGHAKIIGIGREVVGQRRDGSTFPMELAVSEFHLKGGRYFTGIVRDISERKRTEAELRQIAAELTDANRRKTEFLATLAHELRNPLAPIRTGLEVLKMAAGDPTVVERVRQTMERQTQQLVTLVDDLLDVSRITRGKLELRKCRVMFSDIIQIAVETSKPFIDEMGHELAVAIPDQPICLDADPHRLGQVVSNLLNNAAKYTPEGGRIWLTAERQGSDVLVSVRDTGIGIPAGMADRIFEMFEQIHGPMEMGHVGLGIGLTLVKSLVEMHGGMIQVRSEGQNRGSEFSIRLPILVERRAEEAPHRREDEGEAIRNKRRVMVVDDNKAAAEMLSMVVKMLGHDVRTAGDGRQAIEVAAEYLPDVVLMDLGMPKMNGYEAARHIRQQPWGEKTMLIALTGWGQDEDKQRSKQAGFDYHLVKPAEPSKLQQLLASVPRPPG